MVSWYRDRAAELCSDLALSVSRVDLHADWQGWRLTDGDRQRFVCRAHSVVTYEEGKNLLGLTFGKGDLQGRLYDKTLEVKSTGHDWWYEKWGERYDRSEPVLRVEFQFRRELLRSFGMDAPEDVIHGTGDLWRYATVKWLSYRTPAHDDTRARWPVAPQWQQIQEASLAQSVLGLTRVRKGAARGSLRRSIPALTGYLANFAAVVGADNLGDTLAVLPRYVEDYESAKGRSFDEHVDERRALVTV